MTSLLEMKKDIFLKIKKMSRENVVLRVFLFIACYCMQNISLFIDHT